MNLNVRGVHYQPSDETMEFLNKKLQKLSVATMHNVFDNTFSHQNLKPVGVSAVDLSW